MAAYFSGETKIKTSYKARAVRDILLQNPNIKQIGKNPVTLQWFKPFKYSTTITEANPTNLDHYAKNDQITLPCNGIESIQGDEGDEGNVSNVIQKQMVAKSNDDNLPIDIEQTIDLDKKEEINNKNSTLPSLLSSPSGIASLEDNGIVQNNNIDPKHIRMQINHSKAAVIETNDDFELSK